MILQLLLNLIRLICDHFLDIMPLFGSYQDARFETRQQLNVNQSYTVETIGKMLSSNALYFLYMISSTSKNLGPHVSIISFDEFEYSLTALVHFELFGWKFKFDYFN